MGFYERDSIRGQCESAHAERQSDFSAGLRAERERQRQLSPGELALLTAASHVRQAQGWIHTWLAYAPSDFGQSAGWVTRCADREREEWLAALPALLAWLGASDP